MLQIILAPTHELAQSVNPLITIEAEYGDQLVNGSLYTAAHHGSRSSNPAPCIDTQIPNIEDGIILISHLDLDTIGGIARATGYELIDTPKNSSFWQLAAYVDINGPHKIGQSGADEYTIIQLYSYWAMVQANRGPRRDNTMLHDVTEEVFWHLHGLKHILNGDSDDMLEAGEKMMEAETQLERESFISCKYLGERYDVVVRNSAQFVNHLYTSGGKVYNLVLAYNSKNKSITLSSEDGGRSLNCCEIMQAVFGPLAGGHAGIAGSPRGVEMTPDQMNSVLEYIDHLLDVRVEIDWNATEDEVVVLDTIDHTIPEKDRWEDIRLSYKVTGKKEVTFYAEGYDGRCFEPWDSRDVKRACPSLVYLKYSLKNGWFKVIRPEQYTDGVTPVTILVAD